MKFSIQLSSDYPDKAYGGDRVYQDMLAQATLADRLGYDAVAITEHHFMNCLMMPAPLQFAVKMSATTTSPAKIRISRIGRIEICLLYTSPSPRDKRQSRMPSSA